MAAYNRKLYPDKPHPKVVRKIYVEQRVIEDLTCIFFQYNENPDDTWNQKISWHLRRVNGARKREDWKSMYYHLERAVVLFARVHDTNILWDPLVEDCLPHFPQLGKMRKLPWPLHETYIDNIRKYPSIVYRYWNK
jgi:hypothetical protein